MSKYPCCGDLPFEDVVKFLQKMSEVPAKKKDQQIQLFLKKCVPRPSPDIFQTFRLLLPLDDLERRAYKMQQSTLANLLVDAAGLSKENPDAKRTINWRQSGVRNAGNFPEVVEQYVLRKACLAPEDPAAKLITVADVNRLLDKVAGADGDKKLQMSVLRELMRRCTARQVKWIIRVILKDIKIGLSQAKLMNMFHKDALYLLQMTSDLQYVCTQLADPEAYVPHVDIEPGRCVMAQRCTRVNTIEEMYKGMKGQPFTVEVKFDGNRLQLHKTPEAYFYFSRRAREHGELSMYKVFDPVFDKQVSASRLVLDGELIVWNKTRGVFEPFGGLRSTMNAANEGQPPDFVVRMTDTWAEGGTDGTSDTDYLHPTAGDLELVYIAFDILYDEHESLINLPLRQRQQRLAQAVRCIGADEEGVQLGPHHGCIKGRIVTLLPDVPLALPMAGGAPTAPPTGSSLAGAASSSCPAVPGFIFSRTGRSQQDLQDMMDMATSRQEEGIVAKQLESTWKPDDKSGAWLKLKPDYFHMQEVDAVIIGGYYGSGRNGGLVSEFLLGLAEGGGVAGATKWCSFTRVGTGMSDVDRQKMRERLQPVLIPAAPGVKAPACYRVTGREKPDFWVTDPMRSIVVEVISDIRTISTTIYAADHSLRFPRIKRVRWDRSPSDITTYPELEQLVLENKGRLASIKMGLQAGVDLGGFGRSPGWRRRAAGTAAAGGHQAGRPRVVETSALPDTSGVEVTSDLLAGAKVYFHNYCDPSQPESVKAAAKKELGVLVARHGGQVVAAPTPETGFVFAAVLRPDFVEAQRKLEVKRPAAVHDVISVEWLRELDPGAQELIHIMPRHYLFLSAATSTDDARKEEFDEYGNPWYREIEVEDLQALRERHIPTQVYEAYLQLLQQGRKLQEQHEDAVLAAETAAATAGKKGGQASAAAAAAPGREQGSPGLSDSLSDLGGKQFRTEESVVLSLHQQLQVYAGWRDSSAVCFLGCCILFLSYQPSQASPKPPADESGELLAQQHQQQQQASTLMQSAAAARELAASWQRLQDLHALDDAKLAVVQHGGTVAPCYTSAVTHIVLWPLGWRRQHLAAGRLLWQPGHEPQQLSAEQLLPAAAGSAKEGAQGLLETGSFGRISNRFGLGGVGSQEWSMSGAEAAGSGGDGAPLAVPVDQLLKLLAEAASAAADASVAGAASAAAAAAAAASNAAHYARGAARSGSSNGSKLKPSRGRFKIATAPAQAETAAAAGGGGAAAANSAAPANAVPGFEPAATSTAAAPAGVVGSGLPGVRELTARLAAARGESAGGVLQGLLADRAAASTAPQPSPAALKILRKIRRRLAAAQQAASRPVAEDNGTGQSNNSQGGRSRHLRQRGPIMPLLLVDPGWVVDSLGDLQLQLMKQSSQRQPSQLQLTQLQFTQQQQQQLSLQGSLGCYGSQELLFTGLRQQRRNEMVYGVRVLQQQRQQQDILLPQQQEQHLEQEQQQQEDGAVAAAAAAAPGAGAGGDDVAGDVLEWPWDLVGLNSAGAASSEESSDGGTPAKQASTKRKASGSRTARQPRGVRAKAAANSKAGDTSDGDDEEPAAKRRRKGKASAAPAAAAAAGGVDDGEAPVARRSRSRRGQPGTSAAAVGSKRRQAGAATLSSKRGQGGPRRGARSRELDSSEDEPDTEPDSEAAAALEADVTDDTTESNPRSSQEPSLGHSAGSDGQQDQPATTTKSTAAAAAEGGGGEAVSQAAASRARPASQVLSQLLLQPNPDDPPVSSKAQVPGRARESRGKAAVNSSSQRTRRGARGTSGVQSLFDDFAPVFATVPEGPAAGAATATQQHGLHMQGLGLEIGVEQQQQHTQQQQQLGLRQNEQQELHQEAAARLPHHTAAEESSKVAAATPAPAASAGRAGGLVAKSRSKDSLDPPGHSQQQQQQLLPQQQPHSGQAAPKPTTLFDALFAGVPAATQPAAPPKVAAGAAAAKGGLQPLHAQPKPPGTEGVTVASKATQAAKAAPLSSLFLGGDGTAPAAATALRLLPGARAGMASARAAGAAAAPVLLGGADRGDVGAGLVGAQQRAASPQQTAAVKLQQPQAASLFAQAGPSGSGDNAAKAAPDGGNPSGSGQSLPTGKNSLAAKLAKLGVLPRP